MPENTPGAFGPGRVWNPAVFGDSPQRKLTKREKWELRRKKRGEVEQCYREHTPPQVRYLRFLKRVGAV